MFVLFGLGFFAGFYCCFFRLFICFVFVFVMCVFFMGFCLYMFICFLLSLLYCCFLCSFVCFVSFLSSFSPLFSSFFREGGGGGLEVVIVCIFFCWWIRAVAGVVFDVCVCVEYVCVFYSLCVTYCPSGLPLFVGVGGPIELFLVPTSYPRLV